MNSDQKNEKKIHWVFVVSITLKGLNALLEIILGGLFLFTGSVSNIIITLTRGELIEDPTDFIANHLRSLLPYISAHAQIFAAAYFLVHGIIKVVLVWALIRNKLWAYPTSLAVLTIFLAYQLLQLSETQSITLGLLSIFDMFVLWLIWYEYRHIKI
jgi:uncharacterized membrane protein